MDISSEHDQRRSNDGYDLYKCRITPQCGSSKMVISRPDGHSMSPSRATFSNPRHLSECWYTGLVLAEARKVVCVNVERRAYDHDGRLFTDHILLTKILV